MWENENKQTLTQVSNCLSRLMDDLPQQVLPTALLNKLTDADTNVIKLVTDIIAQIYKTPEFLLDMAPPQDRDAITKHIERFQHRILNFIQIQTHPDNLPEILYGQREFGCVYLPTELLQRLYAMGEYVLDFRSIKTKSDEDFKQNSIKIMLLAADWVEYSKRKWGTMPKSEMAIISPLSHNEAQSAVPDTETIPPF